MGTTWRAVVLVRGLRLVQDLRRSLRPAADTRWVSLAEKAFRAVGLRRPAEVAVSDLLSSPVSLGIFGPVIVVPASLEGTLEEAEIEGILLHEAAHVARKDHLAGLLEQLARIAFWWNPLVPRLCGTLDDAQEELCDNHVVQIQGSGFAFARCLVKVAEWTLPCQAVPTTAGLLGRRSLARRLTNLLQKERQVAIAWTHSMSFPLALFVLAAGALLLAGTVKPAPNPPLPQATELPCVLLAKEMASPSSPVIPAVPAIRCTPAMPLQPVLWHATETPSSNQGKASVSVTPATRAIAATKVGDP